MPQRGTHISRETGYTQAEVQALLRKSEKEISAEDIGAASAADVKFKIYNSVTDLGLTAGSATISGVFSAMPNFSIFIGSRNQFAAGQTPGNGTVEIVRADDATRAYIRFYGFSQPAGDYRQFLTSNSPYSPTGTWVNETDSGSFVIQRVNQNDGAAVSIPGYLSSNFSVAKAGYKPIGIAGFSAGNSYVYFSNVHLDGNYFYYEARVSNGGTVNAYPYAIVLYLKT